MRWYQVWAVNPYESVCVGETVSFEVETTGADDDFLLFWFDPYGVFLDDSEQYSLNVNKKVLTIYNALPPHAGMYTVEMRDATYNYAIDTDYFHLEVPDIYLHTLVKSPVKIELGGKDTLMVNKSKEGNLWWTHNGELVRSQDRHYTFVDSQRPKGTELEIFDASAEQAGFYEAVLVKGSCHVRNAFEVQVEDIVSDGAGEADTETLWGIIDHKYLKAFSGDFTGEWYIAPAVLAPAVILFLVLIICIIRQKRKGKRSKKDKGEVEAVHHVLFQEPIFTVPDQVFYPPADTSYDIAPVTSSHPQSSSLGTYGDMPMYDMDSISMSDYDPLLGPPVPPPTSGLRQTYSAVSELEDFSDD
ncbi:hypothetical protein ACROYT_G006508 [Oculina patagonica]